MCAIGIIISVRVVMIQYTQGAKWKQEETQLTTAYRTIEAVRGNIYAEDGSLLATSLPYYDVAMDVNTDYLTDEIFNANVDSLSIAFANLFKDKDQQAFYRMLVNGRKAGDRYVLLEKGVSYDQLQKIKKFPLYRLGKFKGGLIIAEANKRELPFKDLAERTIGYARENIKPVGLEGAFNDYLQGVDGQGLMEKTAGGVWIPLNDQDDLQPQNGEDVVSTININYQDVAESALREQLMKHHAEHGCVVLMEVKTGRVLAIANLARVDSTDKYEETYNYALGEAAEPGSTFKLASLTVAMDDGYVKPTDTINLENGTHEYYDRTMHDAEHDEHGWVTIQRAFEISSNVGISKEIYKYYANQPKKFVDGLCRLGLNEPLHLSIPGEGTPSMPNPSDKTWSGTSLPWLSIGYGLTVTPLQTLTLYNAIANNGVMVKPQFVDRLVKDGKDMKSFQPQIINPSICSSATLAKLRKLLEGVVLRGTASNLKNTVYPIAGKTGTAQIASKNHIYKNGADVKYQASFTGYFPANDPQYSCIVIVNSPSTDGYYGNITAGPIFREIADKVYASSIGIDPSINIAGSKTKKDPFVKSGSYNDACYVLAKLDVPSKGSKAGDWMTSSVEDSTLHISSENPTKILSQGMMPDLHGMNAEDAIYLLENCHLRVSVKGYGAVTEQSISPGTRIEKGQTIYLRLS
jgi:cell division protein FtsI (penicillin-binding protein 3)